MYRTDLNKSLDKFFFEIHHLNNLIEVGDISESSFFDLLYARCYPKWNMSEQELQDSIDDNTEILLKIMEEIAEKNDLFYCYFDIDFTALRGTTVVSSGDRIHWIESRPSITKKNIGGHPKGFFKQGELPTEN